MKMDRKEIKQAAKDSLRGNWNPAILAVLLYYLVYIGIFLPGIVFSNGIYQIENYGFIQGILSVLQLILAGPLALGVMSYFLDFSKGNIKSISSVFDGFRNFTTAFLTSLLFGIFIFLWSLLLFIPGIIAALAYSQVFFILSENPEIKPMDAIQKSKAMMKGHKWEFFVLGLSFFGWIILAIFTCGIGFFWLGPYEMVTYANFYKKVSGEFAGTEDAQFEMVDEESESAKTNSPEL